MTTVEFSLLNDSCRHWFRHFRCHQCVGLFDADSEAMLDRNSEGRRMLTKLTLTFSHMMYELKAFFPDGAYVGDNYTVVKVDAANWWKRHFASR